MDTKVDPKYLEPGEEEVFKEMVELTRKRMDRRNEWMKNEKPVCEHMLRAQHAKETGGVTAEFLFADDVPADLRHGIFEKPGRIFSAIVRFSTSNVAIEADNEGIARGLAIKLLNVQGDRAVPDDGESTQDFLMVNHPVFPFPNPKAYLKTLKWIVRGERFSPSFGRALGFIHMILLLFIRRKSLGISIAIKGKPLASPLKITYWSGTPFWLGSATTSEGHIVKYQAIPRHPA